MAYRPLRHAGAGGAIGSRRRIFGCCAGIYHGPLASPQETAGRGQEFLHHPAGQECHFWFSLLLQNQTCTFVPLAYPWVLSASRQYE